MLSNFILALGFALALVAYMVFTCVFADILKATYKHYSRGNTSHPQPFPIHYAFVVAVVEVCYDTPLAWHRSRMDVVRRNDAARTDARMASMLRHPSAFGDRQRCMNAHPSMQSRTATAGTSSKG